MLLAKAFGLHVVWHIHGGEFGEYASRLPYIGRAVLRCALNRASATVVLSEHWVRRLRRLAPRARWRAVHNGVPISARPETATDPALSVLFLGHLGRYKGGADLVRASALACRSGFRGHVSIAGGEEQPGQRQALEELIAELGCGSQVELIGVVTDKAKADALRSANCFVLPSYVEGMPMSMLEAMAHGMAVIATKVGAIPEVVTDGREGFLVELGDVSALADRMVRLDADPDLRARMGQAAWQRVAAEFGLDRMVEKVMSVYREVLRSNRA
jgi:glycosyltransferase involved in cell wall biosynthesis